MTATPGSVVMESRPFPARVCGSGTVPRNTVSSVGIDFGSTWRVPKTTADPRGNIREWGRSRRRSQAGVKATHVDALYFPVRKPPQYSRSTTGLGRAIALSVRGCGGVGFEVRHAERGDGAGTAQPR